MQDSRPSIGAALVATATLLLSCGGESSGSSGETTTTTTTVTKTAPCDAAVFAEGRDSVRCGRLVDKSGRVIFLHGVNARVEGVFDVTFEDGRTALEPIPPFADEDAARMREIGLNALRLPINWSALEPTEDGGFNEAYLDKVESVVSLCEKHGIRVLIDFHQDAYSKEIGEDGAPLWAISPPPDMLLEGPLTDLEARRTSGQVLDAFDTFFGDSAEGVKLRGRFGLAVAHVADRFKDSPAVTGIEIYNEPLSGDKQCFNLAEEMIAAARPSDPGRLYYFEPSVLRNQFDDSPPADRDPFPGSVYAPHVYTLAFGGSDAQHQAMTKDTLRHSNESARDEADSWKAPLVVGEYGYDPNGIQADNYLTWQTELQDEYQASAFFWVWKEQSQGSWGLFDHDDASGTWTERAHVRKAISRVVPEAVAGWPEGFGFDRTAGRFELKFTSDPAITGDHLLFIPGADDFTAAYEIACDGAALSASRDPKSGLVEVPCGGAAGSSHTITVTAK